MKKFYIKQSPIGKNYELAIVKSSVVSEVIFSGTFDECYTVADGYRAVGYIEDHSRYLLGKKLISS